MDQLHWTDSNLESADDGGTDEAPSLVALLPVAHANFTEILLSVFAANPHAAIKPYHEATLKDVDQDDLDYTNRPCPGSSGATAAEVDIADDVGRMLGLVGQSVFGVCGVLGNLIAVAVLNSTKKLKSVFNQILTLDLVLHTLYILTSIAINVHSLVTPPILCNVPCSVEITYTFH